MIMQVLWPGLFGDNGPRCGEVGLSGFFRSAHGQGVSSPREAKGGCNDHAWPDGDGHFSLRGANALTVCATPAPHAVPRPLPHYSHGGARFSLCGKTALCGVCPVGVVLLYVQVGEVAQQMDSMDWTGGVSIWQTRVAPVLPHTRAPLSLLSLSLPSPITTLHVHASVHTPRAWCTLCVLVLVQVPPAACSTGGTLTGVCYPEHHSPAAVPDQARPPHTLPLEYHPHPYLR